MQVKRFLLVLSVVFLSGCGPYLSTGASDPIVIEQSSTALQSLEGPLAGSQAIILNSLGETLSAVDKSDPRGIRNNIKSGEGSILNAGAAPNQILTKGGLAFILNSLSNNVQIVDLNIPGTLTEISTGVGTNPYFMTLFEHQTGWRIYVTNLLGGKGSNGSVVGFKLGAEGYEKIADIEMPSGNELEPYDAPTKAGPQGICSSNGKIYVTLTNLAGWSAGGPGWVIVIDPDRNEIVKKIRTGGVNAAVVYASPYLDGRVFVANTGTYIGDGIIDVIDTVKDEIITSIPIGGAPAVMTVTDKLKGYVTDALGDHLLSFDAAAGTVLHDDSDPIPVAGGSVPYNFLSFVEVDASGLLWATAFGSDELYVLDPQTDEVVEGPYLMGDGPIGLILDK